MVCDEYFIEHETKRTVAEGIPSTKINRRSFFTASVRSAADRTLDEDLGRARILLKDFAVSEVEGFEDIPWGSRATLHFFRRDYCTFHELFSPFAKRLAKHRVLQGIQDSWTGKRGIYGSVDYTRVCPSSTRPAGTLELGN